MTALDSSHAPFGDIRRVARHNASTRSTARVLSWNMNQTTTSWSYLAELARRYEIDVALLQEARRPVKAPSFPSEPAFESNERWSIPVPVGLNRRYCSAVVCFNEHVNFTPVPATLLSETVYGGFGASHPGQFAVANIALPNQQMLTCISLYGIWDTMADSGEIYAYGSLHRALSDLTPLLQARGANVVLAGDLNVWHGYGGAPWEERFAVVFDRLRSQGLRLAGPFRPHDASALADCPCRQPENCRHVATFRYQRNPANRPYQNDFVFASGHLSAATAVVDEDEVWRHSDHVPVIAEISIESEDAT